MRAYIIALINATTPEPYPEDAKCAAPASAQHGGKYLVRDGAKHPLEGDIPLQRIVVAEFASVEAAKKFDHSPEYQRRARTGWAPQTSTWRSSKARPRAQRRARPPATCTEGDPR
jgi:uncharacterized protein (DUF1330 family)